VHIKWSLVAMAVLAATPAAVLAADVPVVSQKGRVFTPDTLGIAPGTTIRIANDDRVTHHIYIDQPGLKYDSGEQPVGKEVTLRFDNEGRFAVRCAIHPTMRLDVTVASP
jgi:cytochrome c peroxidase